MGMGGAKAPPPAPLSVPRINKAAHTSCDNGSHVCAAPSPLTPAGQPLPPAVRSLQTTPGKAGGEIGGAAVLRRWGVVEAGFGEWGMHKPGYLGRGAGAGGSFVSLETGPCCVSNPFVPLCPFPPGPLARRRGRTWGCGGTGPPLLPIPLLLPGELSCSPLPGRAAGLR